VLLVFPGGIPAAVGIAVPPGGYLLCYLLGVAEIALAFLSCTAGRLQDKAALRIICWTLIIFHGVTITGKLLAYIQGLTGLIWANILPRAVIAFLFIFYGIYQRPDNRA
jgi:hypothetical protein